MLNLELTVSEAQTLLNALTKEPYIEVYELIAKIQAQSAEQLIEPN